MDSSTQYINLLSEVIKKQMIILGPSVALGTARKIGSLAIADDGTVTGINGDPKQAMQNLATAYMTLSGQISQNIFSSIMDKYPEIAQP